MRPEQVVQELTDIQCSVAPDAVESIEQHHLQAIKQLDPRPHIVDQEFLSNLEQQTNKNVVLQDDRRGRKTSVEILTELETEKEKRNVQDFVAYYNDRYEKLKRLLLRRRDIKQAVSINRLEELGEKEDVSIVAMVNDKYKTSKGKFIVYVEDPTGQFKLLVDEEDGERIVEDEVIGVNGTLGDDIIFSDTVIWPDIPLPSDIPNTEEDVAAAFISDIHFGSIDTLNEKIDTFLEWIRSDAPDAKKVRYLFVVGDMVEGVGTYPGQEEELEVTNIRDQYDIFTEFVKEIPDHIQVIVCPGNHDLVRLAEPQPPIQEEVVEDLYEMDNVYMVPNPCYIKIHGHDNNGIRVLLYHGYSFDGHVSTLPYLRENAYENPEHAMIDWLKRRHLAPIYGSNLLVPDEEDLLVIDPVPDIFAMGHTHSFACTTYKGVNVICAGTFQGQTDFQRRVGHKPDPGKVAVINLATRESTVKQF